jgi:AcrR family transcriptional regulator
MAHTSWEDKGTVTIERLTPEARRQQTRTYLLNAAAEVFALRGYHAATLDEVAQAAGFSKGAVYSNFSSKEDLLLALIADRTDRMVQEFFAPTAQGQGFSIEAISEVYRRLMTDENEWALWTEFSLHALRNPPVRQKLVEDGRATAAHVTSLLEESYTDTGIVPPLPPERIARIYIALFMGLAQSRALDPETVPDDLFAEAVVFIGTAVNALGAKRGESRSRRGSKR